MEKSKADALFMQFKEMVPNDKIVALREALTNASDEAFDNLCMVKTHNPIVIILLSVFLGGFGVDRFFIGDIGLGIAKLLLGWFTFGIWPLIDIFFCYKKSKEINLKNILEVC